jgi:hypothetical protein
MTDSSNNDSIGKALNLAPMNDQVRQIVAKAQDDSALADFNIARTNIHEIMQNGTYAIEKLSQIADQSQHPRAFEVLGGLFKTMLDANKDLIELHKKIKDIQGADQPHNEEAKNITNNLFVGSTAELQKAIENMKNGTTS